MSSNDSDALLQLFVKRILAILVSRKDMHVSNDSKSNEVRNLSSLSFSCASNLYD